MHKFAFVALVFVLPFLASAHVVVKPSEVGVGAWQTFNVSVPVEKDIPTTELRLVIPEGLESVTPNVKPGWTINMLKMGEGEDAVVSEISWTGGSIPAGMRDDFYFSAHVPAGEGTLIWKAYQTYEDGSVVSWDSDATEESEEEGESAAGPHSETLIINDLNTSGLMDSEVEKCGPGQKCNVGELAPQQNGNGDVLVSLPFLCWIILSLIMSGVALILGIGSTIRKNPPQQ
jgi:uncharacterized protein YcnI